MKQMDLSKFCDNRAHGGDEIAFGSINGFVCAVVADGVSGSDCGHTASSFAVQSLMEAFHCHYGVNKRECENFDDFVQTVWHGLGGALPSPPMGSSRTTLTAVVIEPGGAMTDGQSWVTAHYVALGDSPIVLCRRQWPGGEPSGLDFLCHPIHDCPLALDHESRIYSYYDATKRRICGTPAIGSFRMYEGDVCLVMSDGIPTLELIARDVFAQSKFRFLQEVKQRGAAAGVAWLTGMVEQKPLQDDGSMVVIHFPDRDQVAGRPKGPSVSEERRQWRGDEVSQCWPPSEATLETEDSEAGCKEDSQMAFQEYS